MRPWLVRNNLLVLEQWPHNLAFKGISFQASPFWIQVSGLAPNQVTTQNAKSIGNFLSQFLEIDYSMLNQPSFEAQLRIKATISVEKPFITGFHSKRLDGLIHWVTLKYERLPDICFNCGSLGHYNINCTAPKVQTSADSTGKRSAFGPWMKAFSPRRQKLMLEGKVASQLRPDDLLSTSKIVSQAGGSSSHQDLSSSPVSQKDLPSSSLAQHRTVSSDPSSHCNVQR